MKYSTIQVTPRLRRRLAAYKQAGMSYEDVLVVLLDAIPAEQFHALFERTRGGLADQLSRVALRSPDEAAEEARRLTSARLARLTPGERMEEAYRLYTVVRGRE